MQTKSVPISHSSGSSRLICSAIFYLHYFPRDNSGSDEDPPSSFMPSDLYNDSIVGRGSVLRVGWVFDSLFRFPAIERTGVVKPRAVLIGGPCVGESDFDSIFTFQSLFEDVEAIFVSGVGGGGGQEFASP